MALLEASSSGRTSDEGFFRVMLARRLNSILNGSFFTPWNVAELPDCEIDMILSVDEIGSYQAGRATVEAKMADWRNKHPGYKTRQ